MKKQEHNTKDSSNGSNDYYSSITTSTLKKFALKQLYFILYHLTRLALAITIMVLISQTTFAGTSFNSTSKNIKQVNQYKRIQEILALWQKNVIVDIITVSTYNCPKNYEPYTSEQWPGTKQGCLCQTILNQYQYVHVLPGQCSLKLINVGCTRIDKQSSIPYAFWNTGKLICVKRIPNLNFYSNISKSLKPSQIKTCANNFAYEFESLSAEPCPITDIANSSSKLPYNLPSINFSYTRQSSYPIVDIKMTQYSFCMEYNRSNISPNRFENYDLQIIQISNCNSSNGGAGDNDPRVITIDQITQKQLFQNNIRINDIITNILPAYPHPTTQYIYKLGMVRYPPWSYQCRITRPTSSILSQQQLSSSSQFSQYQQFSQWKAKFMFQFQQQIGKTQTCIGITFVLICIYGILYSIICAIRHIMDIASKHKNGILFYPDTLVLKHGPNLISQPSLFCQLTIFVLLVVLALALLIQLGVQYQYIILNEQWFRNSYKCMTDTNTVNIDPQTNMPIQNNYGLYFRNWTETAYVKPLQNNIRTYLICLLAVAIMLCIDFIFMVWRFNRGDLQHENIKELFIRENQDIDDISDKDGKNISSNNRRRNTIRDKIDKNSDDEVKDQKQMEYHDKYDNDNVGKVDYDTMDPFANDDKFDLKDRQKTGDIDMFGQQAISQTFRPGSRKNSNRTNSRANNNSPRNNNSRMNRRNTLGLSRGMHQPTNQTEQSIMNQDQISFNDDIEQFNRITLGVSQKKEKKLPTRSKRLQSLDLNDD